MPISIDITVVTYNSRAHLKAMIEGLAAQCSDQLLLNLRVVDNASKDGTVDHLREILRRQEGVFDQISIVPNSTNDGFAIGQNGAAAQGSAPFIFMLNPDAIPSPNCMARLIAEAQEDPDIVAAWEARQVPYEHPKAYDPVTLEVPWCSGAALLVRRSAFEKINGFDPRIFMYCDDVDLSWRLRAAGYSLRYVPSATVHHGTYDEPGEIKSVQYLYSLLGNMYLRARFGNWRDIFAGWCLYLGTIIRPQIFPGQRTGLLRNLPAYIRNFHHFRRSGNPSGVRHQFRIWNYATTRDGAFHTVVTANEFSQRPKVSVLVRTLGKQPLLRRALASVINQTYPNVELVVIEDGPGTLADFLDKFQEIEIVYKALGRNCGRCVAGNAAMELATGEYFIFLDEDDEIYADHIEQLVAEILRSNCLAAYATAFEVPTRYAADGEITEEGSYQVNFRRPFSKLALCRANYIPINCIAFHRSLYEQCGGFDPHLETLEDWDLWLRFCTKTDRFAFIDKTTALYRVPMDHELHKNRVDTHLSYRELARKNQSHMYFTMSVVDLNRELGELLEEVSSAWRISGIIPSANLRIAILRFLRTRFKPETRQKIRQFARTLRLDL